VTNVTLAQSYLRKATDRLDVLDLLYSKGAYSDVVREAQEIVELALKGMLRFVGVEPPKYHDVGPLLVEHRDCFPSVTFEDIAKAASISKALRRERELAFCGDIDFIPTEEYKDGDAREAIGNARFIVALARKAFGAV
jgi:HEPN domain-containing protein